jgi:hypothetical protein
MKAFEITAGTAIEPLPVPSAYRKGGVPARVYPASSNQGGAEGGYRSQPRALCRRNCARRWQLGRAGESGRDSLPTFVIAGARAPTVSGGQTTSLFEFPAPAE